ncbi:zinc-binding alcohol dehydrogenase family protein [Aspergillus vadensis CBS 113365]|uniref:GroES-like protein n=1 Tax=Aspergillus vadensis (strain CBS 113365 / IMI 142717 / IBT 24658) TaxID=1448311 RepID=A0A319B9I7_ASPVC|nr:GroES-like protein [Aspergillus vadensis CBS 113365]PYH68581.1 GroES-like protein [Aspergillus vadensis CBS 113365]
MVKAVAVTAPETISVVSDWPKPTLRHDCILVKVVSVALNPTDWKNALRSTPIVTVGCDYAGIVVDVGSAVTKPFRAGDRVFGVIRGCNPNLPYNGAFSEYVLALGDLQCAIPENLSFQEAATLGVGMGTVAQSLYQSLQLAPFDHPLAQPEPILVYGGATATGTLAIQFAKLSGYEVITTCSPETEELVKSRGADHVFDYKDPEAADKIRDVTQDRLKLVLDTISTDETAAFCGRAMSSQGGDYTAMIDSKVPRADVRSRWTLGYTVFGEELTFRGERIPAKPEDRTFAAEWLENATKLLADGKVVPHPVQLGSGGLQGVIEGLKLLKEGKVRGCKLVYNVDETA